MAVTTKGNTPIIYVVCAQDGKVSKYRGRHLCCEFQHIMPLEKNTVSPNDTIALVNDRYLCYASTSQHQIHVHDITCGLTNVISQFGDHLLKHPTVKQYSLTQALVLSGPHDDKRLFCFSPEHTSEFSDCSFEDKSGKPLRENRLLDACFDTSLNTLWTLEETPPTGIGCTEKVLAKYGVMNRTMRQTIQIHLLISFLVFACVSCFNAFTGSPATLLVIVFLLVSLDTQSTMYGYFFIKYISSTILKPKHKEL